MHASVEKQASFFTSDSNGPVPPGSRPLAILGNISFFGFLAAVVLMSIPVGTGDQWMRSLVVSLICFFSVLRIADGLFRRSVSVAEPRLLIPLTGILIIIVLQILPLDGLPALLSRTRNTTPYISIDPYETQSILLMFAALILLFEGLLHYATTRNRVIWIAGTVLLVGLGTAVTGFLPQLLSDRVVSSVDAAGGYAQFANRNHFALLMEMTFGLLLGLALRGQFPPVLKTVCLTLIVFIGVAIISSNSRGGIISSGVVVLVSILMYLAMTRARKVRTSDERRRRGIVRPALVVIAIIVIFAGSLLLTVVLIGGDQLVTRFEKVGDDIRSADDGRISRIEIWRSTVELIKNYPVAGVGFGAYESGITPFDGSSGGRFKLQQAHNEYLEIAAAGGMPALALSVWFLAALANTVRTRIDRGDRLTRACRLGAAAGIVGVLLHSTVDFGLHVLVNAGVFTLLAVLAVRDFDDSSQTAETRERRRGLGLLGGLLLLLLVILIGALSGLRGLSAYFADPAKLPGSAELALGSNDPNVLTAQGSRLFDNGDLHGALAALDRAIALRPYDAALFTSRGRIRAALGDVGGAEADHRMSVALAPAYAQPNLHLGRFLLNEGRESEAFVYLSRAATLDGGSLAEVLGYACETYPADMAAFVRAVAPSHPEAKKQTALFLLERDQFTGVLDPSLTAGLDHLASRTLVNGLIQKGKFRHAFTLWKTNLRGAEIVMDPENLMIGGDFENIAELDETFGWQVDHGGDHVATSAAANQGANGTQGLLMRFQGDSKPDDLLLWQLVAVEPGNRYRLTFDVIAEKLESGGLPLIVVLDAVSRNVIAESEPFSDSAGEWQSFRIDFSPKDSEGLILGVRRRPCASGPCPIFGQMRLDNFSLREVKN